MQPPVLTHLASLQLHVGELAKPAMVLLIPHLVPDKTISTPLVADCRALLNHLLGSKEAGGNDRVLPTVPWMKEEYEWRFQELKARGVAYVARFEYVLQAANCVLELTGARSVRGLPPMHSIHFYDYTYYPAQWQLALEYTLETLIGTLEAHDKLIDWLAGELKLAVGWSLEAPLAQAEVRHSSD